MSEHDHPEEDDDDEYIELDEELIVFERLHNQERVPEGFSAATVLLDASPASPLKWDEALKSAEELIEKECRIVFDFDLKLSKPLSHSGQFQAYAFALNHFRETVWPKYKESCSGVILYRSSLAFETQVFWSGQERAMLEHPSDELPFLCRDTLVEYLTLLTSHLPDDCPVFLLFDCQEIQDPSLFALLTAQDCFLRFRLGVQHAPFAIHAMSWKDGSSAQDYIGRTYIPAERAPAVVGILLPAFGQPEKANKARLQKTFNYLLKKQIPFKIISQEFLTMEWGGLDTIILSHNSPSVPLQRALAGFTAASGNVISDDSSLEKWLSS